MAQSQPTHINNAVEPSDDTNLPTLADEIEKAHSAVQSSLREAVQHSIECGQLLSTAKVAVPYGGWEDWVEANTPVSARTARAYMQVAEYWNGADAEERQRVADLSFRQMLAELATSRIGNRTVGGGVTVENKESEFVGGGVTVEHKESEIVGGGVTVDPTSGPNPPPKESEPASIEEAEANEEIVRRLESSPSYADISLLAHTIKTLSSMAGRLDPREASSFLRKKSKHNSVGGTEVDPPTTSDIEECLAFLGDLTIE